MARDLAIRKTIRVAFEHRVGFTRDIFSPTNPLLARLLAEADDGRPARAAVFLDASVAAARPSLIGEIDAWFARQAGRIVQPVPTAILPGGEAGKNHWPSLERVWDTIHDARLDRHSFVFAIGGGAFLDLVGFGASTAHRGINLVRFPTTSLSQGDGGVGVKNAVNRYQTKNWVGTFAVPFAVINDTAFLETLPPAERRAGLIEALKVALIRDASFYRDIESWQEALARLDQEPLIATLERSAELHVEHIATSGDPFEMGSARPLDFGHWTAHKLEQMSDFAVSHGEAVAIGMAVDLVYGGRIGMLDPATVDAVLRLIGQLGFPRYHPLLDQRDADGRRLLLGGLEEFREHLGGELTVTLVERIGRGVEVHALELAAIDAAIDTLRQRFGAS